LGLGDFGNVLRLNSVALDVDFTPGFLREVRIFLTNKEDQTRLPLGNLINRLD
tara:strand:- start:179 stop:337 length:159 start_codon:yes stop_codon:yes gene_type:complete